MDIGLPNFPFYFFLLSLLFFFPAILRICVHASEEQIRTIFLIKNEA